ncbi:hypothetical protein T07_9233, partial [Trichinella nelsoni]
LKENYFTSYSTVEYFLEHGLTSVGTISAYRRDVPACLRKAARAQQKNNDDQLRANDKNSNVLLLTSCHTKLKVDNQQDDKRPNIMNDYNLGKRGVDSMDARIEDFCYKKRPTDTPC